MSKNQAKKKPAKQSKRTMVYISLALVLAVAAVASVLLINGQGQKADSVAVLPSKTNAEVTESVSNSQISDTQGVTIDKSAVTEEATFIPYQSGDTYMEVIAIRASDGTVRTALNTCQVCFDSGRGYYKQEGDVLVCQNCGNRFTVDQVEVAKGGCNPVPIFEDDKTETADTITISDEVLTDYSILFSKWKR